jgi:antitoxin component YwqK of YwqJK toxin-antitoxin module
MEICYKSCGEYIVSLAKLNDTITNESRNDIANVSYAKFRGNKFLVTKICHKFTNESIDFIYNTCYKIKLLYKVNEIVEVKFSKDLNEICAEGIHYFKSKEAAYYYCLNTTNYTGKFKVWHDNGQLAVECNYKNGQLYGKYMSWNCNGKNSEINNYIDGKLVGKSVFWI